MSKNENNPYLDTNAGRAEWNDRYLNLTKHLMYWRIIAIFALVVAIMTISLLMIFGPSSHVKTFAVETCNGAPHTIIPVSDKIPEQDALVNYALREYITNARSIIADADAEKHLLDKVYAYTAGATVGLLHDYYEANDPFKNAASYTRQVVIVNSLKISPKTWQITWDEINRNVATNALIDRTRWVATVTYQIGQVNSKYLNANPFGIYFTHMSWSQIAN